MFICKIKKISIKLIDRINKMQFIMFSDNRIKPHMLFFDYFILIALITFDLSVKCLP